MSTALAITDGERTWIHSDRMMIAEPLVTHDPRGKWRSLPCGWHVAVCGVSRLSDLIETLVDRSYALGGLVEAIRQRVLADEWAYRTDGAGPRSWAIELLLARSGEIWQVFSDFTRIPIEAGDLAVIGSGTPYALGAEHALRAYFQDRFQSKRPSTSERLNYAMSAAMRHDVATGFGVWSRELTP